MVNLADLVYILPLGALIAAKNRNKAIFLIV